MTMMQAAGADDDNGDNYCRVTTSVKTDIKTARPENFRIHKKKNNVIHLL